MLNIVFGGAGFIGSNLVKKLRDNQQAVLVIDNLGLGSLSNIENIEGVDVIIGDITADKTMSEVSNYLEVKEISAGNVVVWHLAANSDIVKGVKDAEVDFKDTFLTTKIY